MLAYAFVRLLRLAWMGSLCLGLSQVALGCGEDPRPPPFGGAPAPGAGGGSGGGLPVDRCERPPQPDEANLCGNELVPVLQQKPNLYFVLDVSGSMSLTMDGGTATRLAAAKTALYNLLYEIGHRINYGLAVFPANGPDPSGEGACGTGAEVFETQEGDPVQCVNLWLAGPTLTSFMQTLGPIAAEGGTPLAATLEELTPTVAALPGTTAVVLVTDGAPNCGLNPCEADDCMPNLEGLHHDGQLCDATYNCCDPETIDEPLAALNCVDRPGSVGAVTALAEAGIKTYVIGIPGTEFYVELLDQLAEAGGTAQDGERKYFAISDSSALQGALTEIGNDVAVTCDIALQSGSYDPTLTNVYFDSVIVPASDSDGWTYADQTITLHGSYCDELLSGSVVQVQVVSGCPTIVR